MNPSTIPSTIIERLRANLRAAEIPATEADIEAVIASGLLHRLIAFEQAVANMASDHVPDYLAAWVPDRDTEGIEPGPVVATPPTSAAEPGGSVTTISEIAPLLRDRRLSPVELTEQALERIGERDPELNAFQIVLAEQARTAAHQAEQEIAAGQYRGPLHGVPLAAKDLMAMRGTPATAGSKVLADRVTDFDAAAVERLEAAGAVIVGKTRMSEFAYSPGSNNPHYGPTRNPWNLGHDTGGSSSGSAAAVADHLVYGALGSDTGGSVRIPAALCGLVGLKPTFGRVSLHGVTPLAWSLDHLGPLTRSVADAALLLAVLAGYDDRDPRTRPRTTFTVPTNLEAGVTGLRIGVLHDDGSGQPLGSAEALAAWQAALSVLEQQGAVLIELDLPEMETLRLIGSAILAMEAAAYHAPMLRTHLDDYGSFIRQQRILAAFAYDSGAFMRAQQARNLIRQSYRALFERIDLLSTPAQPDIAPLLGAPASTTFTIPFNVLGWPAISVPAGLSGTGLPLGIQIVGQPWDEGTVLRAARVIEAAQLSPQLYSG